MPKLSTPLIPVHRTRLDAWKHWVAELRSSKHKQARGLLRATVDKGYSYCCLGLACELTRRDGGAAWDRSGSSFEMHGTSTALPTKIRLYLGMSPKQHDFLIACNDDKLMSFKQIADVIENDIMPTIKMNR